MSTFSKSLAWQKSVNCERSKMRLLGGRLLDTLFPVFCPMCMERCDFGQALCEHCIADLPELTSCCPICASPISPGTARPCHRCRFKKPFFTHTFAPFYYAPPISNLIRGLKYNGQIQYTATLARLTAMAAVAAKTRLPDYFLPVPLHRKKFARRGFNQSSELALRLGRLLSIPALRGYVRKTRDGAPQTALRPRQRLTNLRGAFELRKDLPRGHITIVDDVMTTGATVNEIARLLRNKGNVSIWVVAKTAL